MAEIVRVPKEVGETEREGVRVGVEDMLVALLGVPVGVGFDERDT